MASNVSEDLVWQIANKHNSYMFKQRSGGRVLLSRDPLNLTNKHSRKYAGFVRNQAIGIQPAAPASKDNPSKSVTLTTKNPKHLQHPAKSTTKTTFGPGTSSRKIAKSVATNTAKRGYRPDLRREAIARASTVKRSQGNPRVVAEKKPRGKKQKKAVEKAGA